VVLRTRSLELLQIRFGRRLVHLVGRDEPGSFQQGWVIQAELSQEILQVVPRRAAVRARHVEEQHENLAPLDVAEKLVAETDVAMGAFDQAGTSQTVNRKKSGYSTMPICGCRVVNG